MKKWAIIMLFLASLIFWGVSKADAQMMGQGMVGGEESGERAWLGVFIQNITPELAQSMGLKEAEGVLISDVAEGGPAQAAGIEREDVIKGINGREVKTVEDLLSIIREASPGDTITIDMSRRGERASVEVRLGSLKESMGEGMISPEMGGPGMMEQGVPSPQDMGEMIGEMIRKMVWEMVQSMMHGMESMFERDEGFLGESLLSSGFIEELGLTVEQIEKIRGIERNYRKESIRFHSEIEIAMIDLHTLLDKEEMDMEEVKRKVREIETRKTELHLMRIQANRDIKGVLTKEQRESLKSLRNY